MKRKLLLMIALFLLLFSTVFAEEAVTGEQAGPVDTALEETVWRVMEFPSSGEARCIYNYIDHDTYTEAILGYDHFNAVTKEVESIDPVATVLVDHATGKVIYYRRTEYQMPLFLNTSGLFGLHDSSDMDDQWFKLKQKWQDWGIQTYAELTGESRTSCNFLRCRDENCVLFAFCNSPHGDLHAAMIVRLPDEQNPEPLLMAYADLETNPSVGYDGYLTADQATDAALRTIREKSGEEALRDLQLYYRDLTIYDFVVNLIRNFCFGHKGKDYYGGEKAIGVEKFRAKMLQHNTLITKDITIQMLQ